MKKLINRVLQGWGAHPALLGLKRDELRERLVNDIINNMRANENGNGWFLDLSPSYMRNMANPKDK
jgi:hypothetical protein